MKLFRNLTMKIEKMNFILWKITIKHNFCRGLDTWDRERPASPKAQYREGPIRPRPITPGLAYIVKVRHGWDEINSLIKWARILSEIELRLGGVVPNTNRPAKGKAMRGQSNWGQYQALSTTLGNSLPNTNWHLEQVPRESSEIVRIHGDSKGYGNMCQVGK